MYHGNKSSLKLNMIITLVIWCVLCGVSMVGMLVVAADKTIVIEDAAKKDNALSADSSGGYVQGAILEIQQDAEVRQELCIPLDSNIKAEHVIVENKYMDRELWIYIKKADASFYQKNALTGDASGVQKCWYELQEDGLLLKMRMDEVWEYHSTMETGNLRIAFGAPKDIYQQIVVIDVFGGGEETGIIANNCQEKDIVLQVAKLISQKVTQPEIKIYITRSDDMTVSLEKRLGLVGDVEPDLFVQLRVAEAPSDGTQYGIQAYYNEEYFIPEFGNVEWADRVTKEVTVAAANRALGLFPAEDDSILKELDMPATAISIGYLTNEQERTLLTQPVYQEKIASGIAKAIVGVYSENK